MHVQQQALHPEDARLAAPFRLGTVFALGAAAAMSALFFNVPGRGEFFLFTWLAGFFAMFVASGWRGFVAVVSGATASAVLVDLSDGAFGLVFLIVLIVAAISSNGALVATVIRRVARLGLRRSLGDRGVVVGALVALATDVFFGWVAYEVGQG